jgi:uncharacterized FAD-dependent dehydrogenase
VADRDLAPDVLIIGSGPAGLFCAGRLREAGVRRVLVIEQGKAMSRRVCPDSAVCDCRPCDVLEGEGGAGSFSDGKITLSPTRGTHGAELFTPRQASLLGQVEQTIRRFAPAVADYPPVGQLAALRGHEDTGLAFDSYPLIHLGSDGIRDFDRAYAAYLEQAGVELAMGTQAIGLLTRDGQVAGVVVRDRRSRAETVIRASCVVAGCGLAGAGWLEDQLRAAGVHLQTGPADFGIRLETTAAALATFTGEFYDFKLARHAGGIGLRSFCVNGDGFIAAEYHRGLGIRGVNGHSFLGRRSGQSNLAIVATITREHHADPKAYVRELATAVNAAAEGYPIRQRLGDLLPGCQPPAGVRVTNPKTRPGRLQDVLPGSLLDAFCGYIEALGQVESAVLAADALVYAPEIKYYAYRVPVDEGWQSTDVAGLYVIGNASGYTASLSAATLTGIIAADAITTSSPAPPAGQERGRS